MKPFPDPDLYQFAGRRKEGTKGKKVQERLESSIGGFDAAFANTFAPWKKFGNWPTQIKKLEDMHKSVDHYYNRLYKAKIRQPSIHHAEEPMRNAENAVAYVTVERSSAVLEIPKDMRPLCNALIVAERYTPIDVNEYMEGLDTMARYRFMQKVKSGLSAPCQLWSWMKGTSSSGVSTHYLWKIPPKSNLVERAAGEQKTAVIIGELTQKQELHYGRAVMTS